MPADTPPAVCPERLTGLPPRVSERTVVLVLGSFPSVASLAAQQYYAHPQNHFWKILQAIWPEHACPADGYEQRIAWLLARGLGLWDVYASCEREGSLDSRIRHAEVNDFASLKARCPRLQAIAHNGGESFKHAPLVVRSLSAAGPPQGAQPLPVYKLPSTSPANASWSFARKLAAWREVFAAHGLTG
ncbi:DNA-deoxyinosine glycosylase [Ramlibacter sp. 2FC]|uniref:DNA-deoxyinosine glycosylase n=1 Tax=Ramlibacter sp. 2FC TaxID=2502188 RepID=UPI0010F44A54|nr:DNA-deoxyinosine glycosylase [Ramlibacter sp. 2FC]